MKFVLIVLNLLLATAAFAGHSKMTKEEVAKVARYYEANGLGDGDTYLIDGDKLKGPAKKEYDRLTKVKNCKAYGYCPEAYAINAYDTDTIAVSVSDDGGTSFTVYTTDGEVITSCSQGESGDMSCAK